MKPVQVVVDTNVMVSALRSTQGASHRLLRLIDCGKFQLNISVPLILEYEAASKRSTPLAHKDIDAIIDYICSVSIHQTVHYLWRPALSDPQDDMVLEVAVAGGCEAIVTHNKSDFTDARKFGLRILAPREFLLEIGGLP